MFVRHTEGELCLCVKIGDVCLSVCGCFRHERVYDMCVSLGFTLH